MLNDTSRYLDDKLIIDNPDFEKHIPDIYPIERQLNKANTSDEATSILDINMKVIGSNVYTSETPSALGHELASRWAEHNVTGSGGCLNIF